MRPILVATDLTARSDRAVARAARIARSQGRPLHVYCAVDDDLDASATLLREEEVTARIERDCDDDPLMRGLEVRALTGAGAPAGLVPRAARDSDAALVVLGSHANRGIKELTSRPTLVRILEALDRPALVAVGRPETEWRKVLVGWDVSPASKASLALALDLAPDASLTLCHAHHLLHAGTARGGAPTLSRSDRRDILAEMEASVPPEVASRLTAPLIGLGGPVQVLTEACQEEGADLLAMGRNAHWELTRMVMGETATEMALVSPCDVLIAPPG